MDLASDHWGMDMEEKNWKEESEINESESGNLG